jgi:hypothetical protein
VGADKSGKKKLKKEESIMHLFQIGIETGGTLANSRLMQDSFNKK